MTSLPERVVDAYELAGATIVPVTIGLINQTFEVTLPGGSKRVVQRLHEIFAGEVCLDLEALGAHVEAAGLVTPRLVRTRTGDPFVAEGGATWRAITFIPGRTVSVVEQPALAHEAARLAGRFHAALAGVEHRFHFTRSGVHDTAAHLARLARWRDEGRDRPGHAENVPIADAILAHARTIEPLPPLPTRIVHGDLKISNVRFDESLTRAVALLDLDTLAHGTLAFELGDALRSWAQRGAESEAAATADATIVEAAMRGYAASGFPITAEERASIVLGFETIAMELAARFAIDAWEDRYFGWDASRFPSRVEHDRARARGQLALARSVRQRRAELERITDAALRGGAIAG